MLEIVEIGAQLAGYIPEGQSTSNSKWQLLLSWLWFNIWSSGVTCG